MKKEQGINERILEVMKDSIPNPRVVTLDDKVYYGCDCCGKCCFNRNDIILKAIDLYNISKHFKLTIPEFIGKYCDFYLGETSVLPVITLKFKDIPQGGNVCPFIEAKKGPKGEYLGVCGINDVKPGICRMFPVARVAIENEIRYVAGDMNCVPDEYKREIRVGDWINEEVEERAEKVSKIFAEKIDTLYGILSSEDLKYFFELKFEDEYLENSKNKLFNIMVEYLYDMDLKLPIDKAIEKYGSNKDEYLDIFSNTANSIKYIRSQLEEN